MSYHVELAVIAQCAEGTLSEPEARSVREHLAVCRSCTAAYADAVRYRAAWLSDSSAFGLDDEFRRIARSHGREGAASVSPRRLPNLLVPVMAAAAVAVACFAGWRTWTDAPSLGFPLPPAVIEATARSSARGLVLPGTEHLADRISPDLRSGPPAVAVDLDREIRAAIDRYEGGERGPESGSRLVAALLAAGELETARDYARDCLRLHPNSVPLLVFGADAESRANNYEGAEELLRRAAKRAPNDPVVALDLGLVLRHAGREEEARRYLMRAAGARVEAVASRARREISQAP